jgi:hypothetical protein
MADYSDLKRVFNSVYSVVNKFDKPLAPVGSKEHAITGNLTADSLRAVAERMQFDAQSVVLDVGSEMGRPVFCFAAAYTLKGVIGIEIQEMLLAQSREILKALMQDARIVMRSRVFLRHGDILDVRAPFETVTHVYSFSVGMPVNVIRHIVMLAARSDSTRILVLVDNNRGNTLRSMGLECSESQRVVVTMAGSGSSYSMYVIELTNDLKHTLVELNYTIHSEEQRESRGKEILLEKEANEEAFALEDSIYMSRALAFTTATEGRVTRSKKQRTQWPLVY